MAHVKDKWGYPINGWREASRVANYWRRYFGIDEVPYHFHWTEPHEHQSHQNNFETLAEDIPADDGGDDTSQFELPVNVADPTPSVPMQISQLAHVMYNMLLADPEFNAPILELLQIPPADPSESSIHLFT